MKKLLYGLSVAGFTAIPAFLVTLSGCGVLCKCPLPAELPFPTSGSYTLADVQEDATNPVGWDESSWADVTAAQLDAGEDQLVVTLELASGTTIETTLDITGSAYLY